MISPAASRIGRAALNWTRRKLALEARLSAPVITRLEQGEKLRGDSYERIVAAFAKSGVDVSGAMGALEAATAGACGLITTLAGPFRLRPQHGFKRRKKVEGEYSTSTPDTAPAADTGAAQQSRHPRNPCKSAPARAASGES
jgi:transcriptional regulator with XRE-family HTH domain